MTEGEAATPLFGQGELPPSLDRINWGAYFFSVIWALAHNEVKWAAILFGANIVTAGLGLAAGFNEEFGPVGHAVLATVLAFAIFAVRYSFAIGANRSQWERASKATPAALQPVDGWIASQLLWARIGFAFFVAVNLFTLVVLTQSNGWLQTLPILLEIVILVMVANADRRKPDTLQPQS